MIEEYRGSDKMSRMNSKILVGFETLLKKAAKLNKNEQGSNRIKDFGKTSRRRRENKEILQPN